jgi:lysophospholipid acyltransferase (LPLAT)-like uncharacterized protein
MKIRQPWMLKAVGFAVAWLVRLWIGTLCYRYRPLGPNVDPHQPGLDQHYLYAFWHENILLPAYHYGRRNIWVLISEHADGEIIAEACRHLRFRLVRGSLQGGRARSRGAVRALRQMVRISAHGHLAITPDGPRGPRRQVQPGVVWLAARTGLPIIPIGFAFSHAWRMGSWDRFALPYPWSTAVCVTGAPIVVPPDVAANELERYRSAVEEALNKAGAAAEGMLMRTGRRAA